jgi:predicted glycosyltransferase
LGLRDVLDAPAAVRSEWRLHDHVRTVDEVYDAVWVYGDAAAYDVAAEYAFPHEVRRKLTHVGWLDAGRRLAGHAPEEPDTDPRPLYLGLVGGGQDGADVALAFARADAPEGVRRLLVTGPYMPSSAAEGLRRTAAGRDDIEVVPFVREPSLLIRRAERVVTMGGYNSVAEVLAFSARALVVPRVRPRLEQWERAGYLARLGLVDVLHPDGATPDAVAAWWRHSRPRPHARAVLDLGGLDRVPHLALELLRLPTALPVPVPMRTGHSAAS